MLPTLPEEERRWPVKLPFISLEHLAAEVPRRSNIEKRDPGLAKKIRRKPFQEAAGGRSDIFRWDYLPAGGASV
jgi:hypothetical protein